MDWPAIAKDAGLVSGWIAVALLCLGGVALSCLTLSGTWLVVAATGLAAWLGGTAFPGWVTIVVFILLALAVEAFEWLAGLWGVQRRGGSAAAGWAAMGGGLLGMVAGSALTFLGGLVGMILGSFLAAYAVERRRLQSHDPALHIAMGTVIARILVLLIKVGATLTMIGILAFGLLLAG